MAYLRHIFLQVDTGSGKSFVTSSAFAGLGLKKLVNSDSVLTRYLNNRVYL